MLYANLPGEGGLPCGCLYEPEWDGNRLCALAGSGGVSLWFRQGKDLTRYLPDLQKAIEDQVPPGCVLDAEAVIWTDDRLDFVALQGRLVVSQAGLPALIRERHASFAAFDLLAVAGHDIRDAPLAQRQELLAAVPSHRVVLSSAARSPIRWAKKIILQGH